jgi:DNA-binding MarR family transcriptional regulator
MLSKHEENFMAKLTDTQLIVLSAAVAREDGVAVVPAKMKRATASKVGASLVRRKLMRDSPSKRGMPVWREDEDRRRISLIITRAGRKAIEVAENARAHPQSASNEPMSETDASSGKKRSQNRSGDGVTSPRVGTKQALVIEMLCTKGGATLNTLVEATGWLPHTTRAALTGLRKRGFSIERTREEGADSIYRIVSGPAAAAA